MSRAFLQACQDNARAERQQLLAVETALQHSRCPCPVCTDPRPFSALERTRATAHSNCPCAICQHFRVRAGRPAK